MSQLWQWVRGYFSAACGAWNDFWFTAIDAATLSLIRICVGAMLLYTHFIWTFNLYAFFGPRGWLPMELVERDQEIFQNFAWSLFYHIESPALIWCVHIVALVVFVMLMMGLFSRVVSVLAAFLAIMYVVRVSPGAFFGLDKINCFLALYLTIGPCGARYSLDSLWRKRSGNTDEPRPSVSANLAIRLMQWHLAIIYLFSGLGKLQGQAWWTGEATWMSIANLEYQSLDVTFLAHYPALLDLLTHVTVFWELFYIVLIWNRWLRPWMLMIAVGMHGFIALCLGMMTFGIAMLIANLAFVSPRLVRALFDPVARRVSLALTDTGSVAPQSPTKKTGPTQ